MNYAILDIEATGGKVGTEKIIDIYIYKFNGVSVEDQFGSMVNPQRSIDFYVQKLTGITEKMVRSSPKFHELAKRIIEITEDCVLVGHGVDFDYRMLRQEFRELGYDYQRKTLDSLDLSQKLLPDMPSHSLGKLCKSLGIPMHARHTAEGDTRATLELFKLLLEQDKDKKIVNSFAIHNTPTKKQVSKLINLEKDLPTNTGVYYLLDENNHMLFLAAAKNIKQDVNEIFTSTKKTEKRLQTMVEKVNFELTGSFLIAKIKENNERQNFKKLLRPRPKYLTYGLYADQEEGEFLVKTRQRVKQPALLLFNNKRKAYKTLDHFKKKLKITPQTPFEDELALILNKIELAHDNLILIDKGRNEKENSFIEIRDKQLMGYGFYNFYNQIENDEIRENIRIEISSNTLNQNLLRTFMQFHHFLQIVPFSKDKKIKLPKRNDKPRS